jgi:hypothetical protein
MPEAAVPASRHYDLNGQHLAVEAGESGLASFLDGILATFAGAFGPPDWSVRVAVAEALPSPVGELQWQGDLPEGLGAVLYHGASERTLVAPGHFHMRIDAAARQATIVAFQDRTRWLSGTAAFWLLDGILEGHGRHLVHAACLVRPGTDDTVLLFAPSGTGKTTTALALARNGWALAGDDAAVFGLGKKGAKAWALPRGLNLHRHTAALLPWLAPALRDFQGRDEQPVALAAIADLVQLARPIARRCAGIVLLEPRNLEGHHARPLAKADAVVAIALDNVKLTSSGLDANGAGLFDALTRLIAAVPVISLSVGPDPASLAPALLEVALQQILAQGGRR